MSRELTTKRISRNDITALLVIVIVAVVSELSIPGQATLQKIVWVLLAFMGIYIYQRRKERVWRDLFLISNISYLPFVVMAVLTPFLCSLSYSQVDSPLQALTTTLYLIADMLSAYCLVALFKKRAAIILFCAIALSYALSIIFAICELSLQEIFDYFFNGIALSRDYFEKHDVGVAVVPLIFFFACTLKGQSKTMRKQYCVYIVVLIAIMLMCGKRSAYMGFAVGLAMIAGYYLCKTRFNKEKLSVLIAFVFLAGLFMYVCLISTGDLGSIVNALGINSMGRVEVYDWFSDQYDISPFYLGKGFQYIHVYMESGLGSWLVNAFDYLHNSILQIYIEAGFWGFWLWIAFYLIIYPYVIKRLFGSNAFIFTMTIMVSMLTIFLTDNVLTYPLFQLVTNAVILQYALCSKESQCEKGACTRLRRMALSKR